VFFRNGRLKSDSMGPIAAELSDQDIRGIGAFIAASPTAMPAPAADDQPDMSETGAKLAVERHCVSCHGASVGGQQAAARLAGQREEVLLKALRDYKTGARTGTGIAAMPEITYQLGEGEMAALAHYLARLR
jgi:cytochrome c553